MSLVKSLARAGFLVPRAVEKTAVRGHRHIQASLPTTKWNKLESFALKTVISVGIISYPLWVLFHIQEYKGVKPGGDA